MASKLRPKILEAATELFSEFGYYGVTFRSLAKRAKTTEGSLYRLFTSKENLFEEALLSVVGLSLDPDVLMQFEKGQHTRKELASLITRVVKRWYESLPNKAARLLTYAYFVAPKLRHMAVSPYARIDKLIETIAATISEESKSSGARATSRLAVTGLILALLHFKMTYATTCSRAEEEGTVNAFIRVWMGSTL